MCSKPNASLNTDALLRAYLPCKLRWPIATIWKMSLFTQCMMEFLKASTPLPRPHPAPLSICCRRWSHWSPRCRPCSSARVLSGSPRTWSPACLCATLPCGCRRKPASCSTRPSSSTTSCRQVQLAVQRVQPAGPRPAEPVHMSHGLLFLALCGLSHQNTLGAKFDSLLSLYKIRRLRLACGSSTKTRGKLSENYPLVKIIFFFFFL